MSNPVSSMAVMKEAQMQSSTERSDKGTLDWEMITGATTLSEVDGIYKWE